LNYSHHYLELFVDGSIAVGGDVGSLSWHENWFRMAQLATNDSLQKIANSYKFFKNV
jgi:hypothetical protein